MTNGNDLNIPLTESADPIDPNNAFSEYSLTRKSWKSQTIGKLFRFINKVPAAGTLGQVLRKKTNSDYDVEWADNPDELPAGGGVGQVLAKKSSTDGDVEWRDETGADAAAIDQRVQAGVLDWAETGNTDDIPVTKLPESTSSSPGIITAQQYDKINAAIDADHLHDTTQLTNADLQAGDAFLLDDASVPTQTGLSQLKEITVGELDKRYAAAGAGGGSTSELVPAALPAVGDKAVGTLWDNAGTLYELVANTEDPNVYRGSIGQVSAGFLGDSLFEYQTVSPFNRRLYIPRSAPGFASPPATIYTLVQTQGPHGLHSSLAWGRAPADDRGASDADHPNTYAYHKPSGDPTIDALPIGTNFSLTFYSDEGLTTALAFHSANRWERDDRNEANVNPIALAGNTERWGYPKLPSDVAKRGDIPHFASPQTFDHTYPGFQLNPTSADRFIQQMTLLSPVFDLDDNGAGELHCTLTLNLAAASDTNAGFTANDSSHRRFEDTKIELASDVSALGTFSTSALTASAIDALGKKIFRVPVYSVSTLVGRYNILLVKDAGNQVGVYYYWEGEAGATQYTLTADLRVSFWPSDSGSAGSGRSIGETVRQTFSPNRNINTRYTTTIDFPDDDTYAFFTVGISPSTGTSPTFSTT